MSPRGASSDFIGRAAELDQLAAALATAASGRAHTVLIGGDAGVGKSRLVAEFATRARAAGVVVAAGQCVPSSSGLPYGPVVGALRDLGRQLDDPSVAELLTLLAGGGEAETVGPVNGAAQVRPDLLGEQFARTRVFETMLRCLADLGERSTVALVFDDLQWADSATTDLVGFLARNLSSEHILLVGIFRTDEVSRSHPVRGWLSELARHGSVSKLTLTGLDRSDVATLVHDIVGTDVDWTLVDAVWSRSQGNPFYVEELTAARNSTSLPEDLRDVVTARIDQMAEPLRRLVGAASVAGSSVSHQLLATMAAVPADELDSLLQRAVDEHVLVPDNDTATYQFRHVLLREAIYASLLPGQRQAWHRIIAKALAEPDSVIELTPNHRANELATHWWSAGVWEEAFAPSLVAADAAFSMLAYPESQAHCERALAALDRVPALSVRIGVTRREVLERAANAAYFAGDTARSIELIRAAIAEVDAAADPITAARCYVQLGRNEWGISASVAAFDAYRMARELLPHDQPSAQLASTLGEEGRAHMLMFRSSVAARLCEQAIAVARAAGARSEEGHAVATLAVARFELGNTDEALELVREGLAIAEETRRVEDINRAYRYLSHILLESGQYEATLTVHDEEIAVGERLWGIELNGAAVNVADAMTRMGRYEEAEAFLARIDAVDRIGVCVTTPMSLPVPIAICRGDFELAGRLLHALEEATKSLEDIQTRGQYHLLAAELAVEEGRPVDASADLEAALAIASGTEDEVWRPRVHAVAVRALADQAEAAGATGARFDLDKAKIVATQHADAVQEIAARQLAEWGYVRPRAAAFAALAAAERSRFEDSDPDLWATAAQLWEDVHEPFSHAYCLWREAEALLEGRTGRDRATAAITAAWQLCDGLGARHLRGQIEDLALRARISITHADVVPDDGAPDLCSDLGLTPRELEVLGYLARAQTDREIAEALFISKKTASVHVSNLLRKLDVGSRIEAGKVGRANGLGVLAEA